MTFTVRQDANGQWRVVGRDGAELARFPSNAEAWRWAERQETHPLHLCNRTALRLNAFNIARTKRGKQRGRP